MAESVNQTTEAPDRFSVDRRSPVPLYHQLARHLEKQIRSRRFRLDERFPTDEELAAEFQVSRPTVRQALNDLVGQGLLVRERGRGTFVRPGATGRTLDNKVIRYRRLGLVMPWGPGTMFAPLLEVVEDQAHKAGFHTVLVNNREDADVELQKVRELLKNGIDGLLWMCPSGGPNDAYAHTIMETVPVVVAIDRAVPILNIRMNTVEADNVGGMKQVVQYLLGKGCRKIAMVHESLSVSSAGERVTGYTEALTEAGIEVNRDWIFSSRRKFYDNGRFCAEKILRSGTDFDAICCHTDTTAVGVIHYLHEKNIAVPGDISVTGFNDDHSIATIVQPQLTTAKIDVPEMGRQAVKLVLDQLEQLDKGQPVTTATISVPVQLVVRSSA